MKIQERKKQEYGLISMIAIIISTVIGSGIYVKNDSIMDQTQSAILSMISWLIAGFLVLAILISFIEISTITSKRGEQGTLNNWTRYLWGPKTARFIGIYFLFIYFPLVIVSEGTFAINQLFSNTSFNNQTSSFLISTFVIAFFLIVVFLFSLYMIKTTKSILNVGTFLKFLPLFFIIFLMVFVGVGLVTNENNEGLNSIFNPDDPINSGLGEQSTFGSISQIFLVLPAILFAFDGFLYSASMSTEAKTEGTYRKAAIIAIFIIIAIYFLFSISTYALANSGDSNGCEINNVIFYIFPNHDWIAKFFSFTIAIAILVSCFGYAMASMWTLADASNSNEIVDKNGFLIRRYKNGNPILSGFYILGFSLLVLFFVRSFDLIYLVSATNGVEADGIYIGMTDYISNFYTVLNFSVYILIIFGALLNRWTNKIRVDKLKLFIPAAIIAIVSMFFVVAVMSYDIFSDLISGISSDDSDLVHGSIIELSSIVLILSLVILIYIYQTWNIRRQKFEIWIAKIPYQQAYSQHSDYQSFVNSLE